MNGHLHVKQSPHPGLWSAGCPRGWGGVLTTLQLVRRERREVEKAWRCRKRTDFSFWGWHLQIPFPLDEVTFKLDSSRNIKSEMRFYFWSALLLRTWNTFRRTRIKSQSSSMYEAMIILQLVDGTENGYKNAKGSCKWLKGIQETLEQHRNRIQTSWLLDLCLTTKSFFSETFKKLKSTQHQQVKDRSNACLRFS